MRPKIFGLKNAILQVLQNCYDNPVHWKEIANRIRAYVDITPEQEEETYGQPNFHHSIRKTLSMLVSKGKIIRVSRGTYSRLLSNETIKK